MNPNLLKYLKTLHSYSDKYRVRVEHIAKLKKDEAKLKKSPVPLAIHELMKDFYIPMNQENLAAVGFFIESNPIDKKNFARNKFKITQCFHSEKSFPIKITVDRPSIVVQIQQQLTNDDFVELKKTLNKPIEQLQALGLKTSMRDLPKLSQGGYETIDLMLDIYEMYTNHNQTYEKPMKVKEIKDKLDARNDTAMSKLNTSYEEADIRKKLGQIKKLLKNI